MDREPHSSETGTSTNIKSVALYVTCLINSCRPEIAWDCVNLLKSLGFHVEVPMDQSCCGQPGYNGGHNVSSLAQQQIECLEPFDYVVIPSGSCAGMIINHYPSLFEPNSQWQQRSQKLAGKTYELSDFLLRQGWTPTRLSAGSESVPTRYSHHTSCSCRRETGSHGATQSLIEKLNVPIGQLKDQEVCCGFGGSFSEKFSAIAQRMALNKLECIESAGSDAVIAADLGCLLHLEACATVNKKPIKFLHLAQVLNQYSDSPK